LRTGFSIGVFAISRLKSVAKRELLFSFLELLIVEESSLPKRAYILSLFTLEFDSFDNEITY